MTEKLVVIDPGHGGSDPGAVGNGLQEKNLTLAISLMVAGALQKLGIDVLLTRHADADVSLKSRTDKANKAAAGCLVSIHINSAASAAANGFESYIYTTDDQYSKSFALQKAIHNRVDDLWEKNARSDRGMKRANFHMVREFKGAAVLLELGFIVNKQDSDLLKSQDFLEENARAIAAGIAEFLGVDTAPQKPKTIYRLVVDGQQVGAYSVVDNLLAAVKPALKSNAKRIEINLA